MTLPHEYRAIGQIWPVGIPISQSWADIGMLMKVVHDAQIAFLFEIGVHRGGLASLFLLREKANPHFRYMGVEIDQTLVDGSIPASRYVIGDAWAPGFVTWVGEMVRATNGPALILCDGGNKPRELKLYAPLLRSGDWIACHDYGTEVSEKDVQIDGLEPYRPHWVALTHWYVLRKP